MKNPGRCHLNQIINANITTNKITQHHVPLDMIQWDRTGMTSVWYLPKMKILNLHQQISNRPKIRDILKGNLTIKKCQGYGRQRNTKINYSALKNIKMTRQLKAIKDPQLGFRGNIIFFLERILLDNWENFNQIFRLDDSIILRLIAWFYGCPWLSKRVPLSLRK